MPHSGEVRASPSEGAVQAGSKRAMPTPSQAAVNATGLSRADSPTSGVSSPPAHQPLYQFVDGDNNISLPTSEFPTCNYDACESAAFKSFREGLYDAGSAGNYNKLRWFLILVIGVLTALVAYFIDVMVEKLGHWKNSHVADLISDAGNKSAPKPYQHLMLINVGFVAIAAAMVAVAPVAGGSGIPEIKCYLNGLRLPQVLNLRTLVAKALGVLPIKAVWAERFLHKYFVPFRDDKSKRDFISCGAAAGVSAAFGAPVGGVLFALEEGCSFWDVELTWRIFFCSIVCAFTMAMLTGETNGQHSLNAPGMIDFGDFSEAGVVPFRLVEVPWFILIGVAGGLLGALFNATNMQITKLRRAVYSKPLVKPSTPGLPSAPVKPRFTSKQVRAMKFVEALFVGVLVSLTVWVSLSGIPTMCSDIPKEDPSSTAEDMSESYVNVPGCDSGNTTLNTLATLQLNSAAKSLRTLFHFPGHLDNNALFTHGVLYLLLMVYTYGVAVPSGLFVPSLVTGAVFGRIVGQLVKEIPYHNYEDLHPGTYALVGAAAFLAGVCRLTFSLAVILIEATRDIAYALPLMLAIMTAKLVGDMFNKGIYDEHIEFRHLAFLEHSIPQEVVRNTTVRDFMTKSRKLVTVNPVERVSAIVKILKENSFCGVPVCRDDHQHFGTEHDGLMTRSRLLALLSKKQFLRKRSVTIERSALQKMSNDDDLQMFPEAQSLLTTMTDDCIERVYGEVTWGDVNEYVSGMEDSLLTSSVLSRTRRAALNSIRVTLQGGEERLAMPVCAVHDTPMSNEFIPWEQFNYPYTDYRDLKGAAGLQSLVDSFGEDDLQSFVDLRPYMNPQPFLVPDNFSFERCYKLFRSVGMRHMLVIDSNHLITGIITRYDLWNRCHLLMHPPKGYATVRGRLVKEITPTSNIELGGGQPGTVEVDDGESEESESRYLIDNDEGGSFFTDNEYDALLNPDFNPNF
eukprot:TRINITY_DN27598_c0_g1_i2.p1 TRINITY_DN27598_c0_g1~~TRINITY_DN27598_c0_g1_i2.p1  ORF type:complete len:963 (+),score=351.05 TRINITY_DN27598_c0_g1_i2:35-2923(+)